MGKHCEICGRAIISGRKYCWEHRNNQEGGIVDERIRRELINSSMQFLFLGMVLIIAPIWIFIQFYRVIPPKFYLLLLLMLIIGIIFIFLFRQQTKRNDRLYPFDKNKVNRYEKHLIKKEMINTQIRNRRIFKNVLGIK